MSSDIPKGQISTDNIGRSLALKARNNKIRFTYSNTIYDVYQPWCKQLKLF